MMHPLIHTELARAADADIERRARAQRPATVSQARRRHWRIARRRLVLGLARPARAAQ
ncbi:MAG TPA: hypothetical protein VHJ39_08065 [Solirubrobacteraceae bacterium]|nr:hypothetical protein [Solirubrobacteraceae bacterium]